jgi:hypothetical protein
MGRWDGGELEVAKPKPFKDDWLMSSRQSLELAVSAFNVGCRRADCECGKQAVTMRSGISGGE